MRWAFSVLFDIQLRHPYYAGGQCPVVSVVPTQETEQQLRDTGLYFKPAVTGGAVVGEPSRPLRYPGRFTFWLTANSGSFLHVTELPALQPGQTQLALSTRNAHLENTAIVLTANPNVAGITEADRYAVNALPFPVTPESSRAGVFGVIEIGFSDTVPVEFQCVQPDLSLSPRTYTIGFTARQAYWRYVVVTRHRPHTQASDLTLTGPASDPVFQGAFSAQPEIQLADGSRAIPFVSPRSFPLQAKAVHGFTLTKSAGATPDAFELAHLPNPAVAQVREDAVTHTWVAEQLIYI